MGLSFGERDGGHFDLGVGIGRCTEGEMEIDA